MKLTPRAGVLRKLGATEETIIATIGSAASSKDVLEDPQRIDHTAPKFTEDLPSFSPFENDAILNLDVARNWIAIRVYRHLHEHL